MNTDGTRAVATCRIATFAENTKSERGFATLTAAAGRSEMVEHARQFDNTAVAPRLESTANRHGTEPPFGPALLRRWIADVVVWVRPHWPCTIFGETSGKGLHQPG